MKRRSQDGKAFGSLSSCRGDGTTRAPLAPAARSPAAPPSYANTQASSYFLPPHMQGPQMASWPSWDVLRNPPRLHIPATNGTPTLPYAGCSSELVPALPHAASSTFCVSSRLSFLVPDHTLSSRCKVVSSFSPALRYQSAPAAWPPSLALDVQPRLNPRGPTDQHCSSC